MRAPQRRVPAPGARRAGLVGRADDAALFHQKVPGVYWQLGARTEAKGFDKPGHSPYFDFDEDALPLGAAVHAQAVEDFLLR